MKKDMTPAVIIEDVISHVYEGSIAFYRPMTKGQVVLKRMHNYKDISLVQKILKIDINTQIKILDTMSEVVISIPRKLSQFPDWFEELDKKAKKLEKIGKYLDFLDKEFKKIDKKNQEKIMRQTASLTIYNIKYIRELIAQAVWETAYEQIKNFLLIDQLLVCIIDILNRARNAKPENIIKYFQTSLWLMLRLWAYTRGKIKIEELETDIADLSLPPSNKYILQEEYQPVIEIL